MIPGISFALALLAFSLQALGEDGDMCFLTGVKSKLVSAKEGQCVVAEMAGSQHCER
jgi:hypothetical protein